MKSEVGTARQAIHSATNVVNKIAVLYPQIPLRHGRTTRSGGAGGVLIPRCDLFHSATSAQFDSSLLHGYERIAAARIDNELVALVPG